MWDLTKRIFHFISTVVLNSLFFIMAIILIMVALYFFDQIQAKNSGETRSPLFGAFIILTDSMVPAIDPGDAVITMRVAAEDLKKHNVITFISTEHNSVTVTHRIIGIRDNANGGYAFQTKGDHNNVEDDEWVTYDRIIGKVILTIPYIGYLQQFLTQGAGWFLLIILPCLWIIISDIIKIFKKASNNNPNPNLKETNDVIDNKSSSIKNKQSNLDFKIDSSIPEVKIVEVEDNNMNKIKNENSNNYTVDNSAIEFLEEEEDEKNN